jgi:hypothetical protein
MVFPLIHHGKSVPSRGFAAWRSTWTSIYQAKLQAKILFLDTKQSFYLCSVRRLEADD